MVDYPRSLQPHTLFKFSLGHVQPTYFFRVVNQIVNAARMTTVKNKLISSTQVATINVKEHDKDDVPNKAGLVAFNLPKESQLQKNLENCTVGSAEKEENTILMVLTVRSRLFDAHRLICLAHDFFILLYNHVIEY